MHKSFINKGEKSIPIPENKEMVALGWARWNDATRNAGSGEPKTTIKTAIELQIYHRILNIIFASSPHLTQSLLAEPIFLEKLLKIGPTMALAWSTKILKKNSKAASTSSLSTALRIAKRRIALTIAIADITQIWTLKKVMAALSNFAEIAVSIATQHGLLEIAKTGAFKLPYQNNPERDSGLIILGMGKLGAKELNYSSDIDLIILFDPNRVKTNDKSSIQANFIRLTRLIVKLLDERTADGYVFRTDLRLRPDPGSNPLAISVHGAELYYETVGQNWERAALIKARPIAGDRVAGDAFIRALDPFIWRKNLDFAAIRDIQSIKRQIHSYKAKKYISSLGYDVKLGSGGIREIEFFAQTQQLIWGGRMPELQVKSTSNCLIALAQTKKIPKKTQRELEAAYHFLRLVEHRLQMVNDAQTHSLPVDEEALQKFVVFLGFFNKENFQKTFSYHNELVQYHYNSLFKNEPDLSLTGLSAGNLVFTGIDLDSGTLQTLADLGFESPKKITQIIKGWHHGRIRATRSHTARQTLTELMPAFLSEIAQQPDPDLTFLNFNSFIEGLPSGVQLFAMFQSNPALLTLICEIIGVAPSLATHLSRNPSILESFLDRGFMDTVLPSKLLKKQLSTLLESVSYAEEKFDVTRRWNNDRRFQVGVQLLRRLITAEKAQLLLSNIAETAINVLANDVEQQFIIEHGKIKNASFAVIALGNFGSKELTWTSDLDLIFLYDHPRNAQNSDGERSLAPSQYFGRLCQRFINCVNALTTEGRLYDLDMRLRPYGQKGPIAVSLEAFQKYYFENAWTWEKMALTRARIVYGEPKLAQKILTHITQVLQTPINQVYLLKNIEKMRRRISKTFEPKDTWALKHIRGGIFDLNFVIQYLVLSNAPKHPDLIFANTESKIKRLTEIEAITDQDAQYLHRAATLWKTLQTIVSLASNNGNEKSFSPQLKNILAEAINLENFCDLEIYKSELAEEIKNIYDRIIASRAY